MFLFLFCFFDFSSLPEYVWDCHINIISFAFGFCFIFFYSKINFTTILIARSEQRKKKKEQKKTIFLYFSIPVIINSSKTFFYLTTTKKKEKKSFSFSFCIRLNICFSRIFFNNSWHRISLVMISFYLKERNEYFFVLVVLKEPPNS